MTGINPTETTCDGNTTYENCSGAADLALTKYISKLNPAEDHIMAWYMLILSLVSLVLNGIVFAVLWRKRRVLRTVEVFLINLAITDLGITVFYPLVIAASFQHVWNFGDKGCIVYGFQGFFFAIAHICTLVVIAIYRCVKSAQISQGRDMKRSHLVMCITAIYVYSLLWSAFPLLGWGSYGPELYGLSCSLHFTDMSPSYTIVIFLLCCLAPFTIIVVCYILITWRVYMTSQTMELHQQSNINAQNHGKKTGTIARMTVLVTMGYLLAWTPYAIVSLWCAYGNPENVPVRLSAVCPLLAKTAAVYSPLVYICNSSQFRREIRLLFNCVQHVSPAQPSPGSTFEANPAGNIIMQSLHPREPTMIG